MKNNYKYIFTFLTAALLFWVIPSTGFAQDFVYKPKNPAFGGNPINYSWLLSSADTQNLYQGSRSFGLDRNPLDNFQSSLQRQILRQLTNNILKDRFGDIDLSEGGEYSFGNFNIEVVPGPNGINVIIQNLSTGEQTTITIPDM